MRPDHRKSEALQRRSAHLWHGATGPPVAVSRSRCAANPLPPLPCWRSEFSALVGLRPDFQTEAAKAAAVLRAPAAVKRAEPVVRPEAALPEAAARQVKAEARPYAAVAPAPAARSACAPAAAEERSCASQSRTADNVHPAGPSQCASNPQPNGVRAASVHAARAVLRAAAGIVLRHSELHVPSAERLRSKRRPVRFDPGRDRGLRLRLSCGRAGR